MAKPTPKRKDSLVTADAATISQPKAFRLETTSRSQSLFTHGSYSATI